MKAISRLYQILEYKGIKPTSFEKSIGLSSGYLSNQRKRNADMGETIMSKVIDSFEDINPIWLITGQGYMTIDSSNIDKPKVIPVSTEKTIYNQGDQEVPLYDISAAAGCIMLFQDSNNLVPIDTIKIPNLAKCDGAIFARGDSMYPIIKSGDLILYKIMHGYETIIWGETYIICYESYGDCYTVVKYVKRSTTQDDTLLLLSHNEHHQPFEIHISQVKSMALVRASVRYNNM